MGADEFKKIRMGVDTGSSLAGLVIIQYTYTYTIPTVVKIKYFSR